MKYILSLTLFSLTLHANEENSLVSFYKPSFYSSMQCLETSIVVHEDFKRLTQAVYAAVTDNACEVALNEIRTFITEKPKDAYRYYQHSLRKSGCQPDGNRLEG